MIAEEQEQWAEAEQWYRQSLIIRERLGDEYGQAQTFHQLGKLAEKRCNIADAVRFYEQMEAIFVRLNDPYRLEVVRQSLQRVRGGSHS